MRLWLPHDKVQSYVPERNVEGAAIDPQVHSLFSPPARLYRHSLVEHCLTLLWKVEGENYTLWN